MWNSWVAIRIRGGLKFAALLDEIMDSETDNTTFIGPLYGTQVQLWFMPCQRPHIGTTPCKNWQKVLFFIASGHSPKIHDYTLHIMTGLATPLPPPTWGTCKISKKKCKPGAGTSGSDKGARCGEFRILAGFSWRGLKVVEAIFGGSYTSSAYHVMISATNESSCYRQWQKIK